VRRGRSLAIDNQCATKKSQREIVSKDKFFFFMKLLEPVKIGGNYGKPQWLGSLSLNSDIAK
jgi:hypothetical protein